MFYVVVNMRGVLRVLQLGFVNFVRNGSVNATAVSIMLLVSLCISFFTVLAMNINQAIVIVEQKADASIFIKDTANPNDIIQLRELLKNNPDVNQEKLTYISKEQALEIFRGRQTDVHISEEDNPLPASFEIKATNPQKLSGIIKSIENNPAIEPNGIKYNKEAVNKIIYWANVLRNLGIAIIGFLVIISFMVIINTIRLAVFTRKEEIEIMKLVGATDWFIRAPFILELAYAGIIATLLSLAIFGLAFTTINSQLSIILRVPLFVPTIKMVVLFVLLQLGWGSLLGALSSYVATHAHLRV